MSESDQTIQKPTTARGEKGEIIKVLVLMIISFLLGFALVIMFLKPDSAGTSDTVTQSPPAPLAATAPDTSPPKPETPSSSRYAPADSPVEPANQETEDQRDERVAIPETPPGRTPAGVAVDGDALYLKCWNSDSDRQKGPACGRLPVLEKRFSTRLYVVDKCKKKHVGAEAEGKLSLGVEVDFARHALTFWSGPSSTLEQGTKVAACLRTALAGLPIDGFNHKYATYRLFFTVLFGEAALKVAEQRKPPQAAPDNLTKGRLVQVIKDRVRVRRQPIDGEVFGKISSGNQVRLLAEKKGWCHVITPNRNEGWMICDALAK